MASLAVSSTEPPSQGQRAGSKAEPRKLGYRSKGRLVVTTWNAGSLYAADHAKIEALAGKLFDLHVDLANLIEVNERGAVESVVASLNAKSSRHQKFSYFFHATNARASVMHLALIYRESAFLNKAADHECGRFDDKKWNVLMTDPSNGRDFELAFRRGYHVTLNPVCTGGHPLVVVGVHLKSLRGNAFSHYKRMAQARIVRAALQNSLDCDWLVLGDFNSSSTDPAIAPIGDLPAAAVRFQSLVPDSQRTFICDTLRTMDVRNPGYSLHTCHTDAAPTWRRRVGDSTEMIDSQLDHILYRFGDRHGSGAHPRADAMTMCVDYVERDISWLEAEVDTEVASAGTRDYSDHATLSVSLHFASKAFIQHQEQRAITAQALTGENKAKKKKKKKKKKKANKKQQPLPAAAAATDTK